MSKSPKSSKVSSYISRSNSNGFPTLVASLTAAERLGGVTYSDLRYTASLEETLEKGPPKALTDSRGGGARHGNGFTGATTRSPKKRRRNRDDDEESLNLTTFLSRPSVVASVMKGRTGEGPEGDATTSDESISSPGVDSDCTDDSFKDSMMRRNTVQNTILTPSGSFVSEGSARTQPPTRNIQISVDATITPTSSAMAMATATATGTFNSPNKINPSLNLPVIRAVSPRTSRKISRLPKPNEKEQRRVKEIEDKFQVQKEAGMFSVYARDKRDRPGGLYGKLGQEGVKRYKDNKGGAELNDDKLISKLLTGDISELLADPNAKAGARDLQRTKKTTKRRRMPQKVNKPNFSVTTPLPQQPPLFELKTNQELMKSLSEFYDGKVITQMEVERKKNMKVLSKKIQAEKYRLGDQTATHILQLRAQLKNSEVAIGARQKKAQADLHDAKYAGFVPENMLGADEKKGIHFEKGVKILNKFLGRQLGKLMLASVRKWRDGAEVVYQEILVMSARVVQRGYRKHQARVELAERMEQRRVQKEREDAIKRAFETKINTAALHIQQGWRIKMARRKVERQRIMKREVQVIQRAWRCYLARLVLQGERDQWQFQIDNVLLIQKHWRANRGRMRFRIFQKIRVTEVMERMELERKAKIKTFFEDQGAAVQIQYAWRRRQLWLNLRYFMGGQKQLKAVRLQQGYRLFKAKLEVKRRRRAKHLADELRMSSVITMQTQVRRYLAKLKVDKIKFDREKASIIRQLEKVHALRPRILVLPIKKKPPKEKKGERKGKPKLDPETGLEMKPSPVKINLKKKKRQAIDIARALNPYTFSREKRLATLIQKSYRGHRARARVTFKRQMEKVALKAWQKQKQVSCAVLVQAMFRGFKGRKYVTLLRHTTSCLFIQKNVRGWSGRKVATQHKREKVASTCIQRHQRGYVKRVAYDKYVKTFKVQQKPARVIQRAGRAFIAKLAVIMARHAARLKGEQIVIARANGAACWKRSRLDILIKSIYAPNGHKHDGVFQEFFKFWSGSDHGASGNHMENAHFIKVFRDLGEKEVLGVKFHDYNMNKDRPFEVTDLDLIFSRHKGDHVQHLTYLQFVGILDQLNAELFPKFKDYLGYRGKEARVLDLVLNKFFKTHYDANKKKNEKRRKRDSGVKFKKALDDRTDRFIFLKASMIQAQARGYHCHLTFKREKAERDEVARIKRDQMKSIHIQKLVRKFLARLKVIKMAERIYVKYVDPSTEEPYWSNPRTKVVSWAKPKIFGKFSDVSHPTLLPHKGTEFVIMCVNCNMEIVDLVCQSCDDAYCSSCFNSLHTKGTRKNHKPLNINVCMECDYQLATKTCETCTAQQHKACNYCDVCHKNVHRFEGDGKTKKHNWSWKVQPCVECKDFAARWRCEECQDVYCTACFSKVHKRGSRVNHKCEPLSYYTPTIHDHYEREIREKFRRARKAGDEHEMAMERQRKEFQSARLVQRRFRGFRARKFGRAFLKEERKKVRDKWKQRKKDNLVRVTKKYQALEPLGLAKRLDSDSMEEAVLKRIPILLRRRAKFWIKKNLQDNYWFEENIKDKKKIPKRGFDVGKYEELVEQAKYGGVRLPGKHGIEQGKMDVTTEKIPLNRFVAVHDRVRISRQTYTVDKDAPDLLTEKIIPIDRVWRYKNKKELVMYKFPPQHKYVALGRKFVYGVIQSQALQIMLRIFLKGGDLVEKLMDIGVRLAKDRLSMKFAGQVKKYKDGFAERKKKLRYFDKVKQSRTAVNDEEAAAALTLLDPNAEEDKDLERADKYLDDNLGDWEERVDEKTLKVIWVHKFTGEITDIKPDEAEEKIAKAEEERKFKADQKRIAKLRKGGRKELGKRARR